MVNSLASIGFSSQAMEILWDRIKTGKPLAKIRGQYFDSLVVANRTALGETKGQELSVSLIVGRDKVEPDMLYLRIMRDITRNYAFEKEASKIRFSRRTFIEHYCLDVAFSLGERFETAMVTFFGLKNRQEKISSFHEILYAGDVAGETIPYPTLLTFRLCNAKSTARETIGLALSACVEFLLSAPDEELLMIRDGKVVLTELRDSLRELTGIKQEEVYDLSGLLRLT